LDPDFLSGGTEESIKKSAIKSKDTSVVLGMTKGSLTSMILAELVEV